MNVDILLMMSVGPLFFTPTNGSSGLTSIQDVGQHTTWLDGGSVVRTEFS